MRPCSLGCCVLVVSYAMCTRILCEPSSHEPDVVWKDVTTVEIMEEIGDFRPTFCCENLVPFNCTSSKVARSNR
jgi:hypothetical protein